MSSLTQCHAFHSRRSASARRSAVKTLTHSLELGFALLAVFATTSPSALATPTRNRELLKRAVEIPEVSGQKEFYADAEGPGGIARFRELEVYVVVREVEDKVRKGWFDFEFVGRAAVAEVASGRAHFVLYKPFKGMELKKGDRILSTGDPLTLDEMELMRKEVVGVLQRDKEIEDHLTGLISVKLGLYSGSLDSSSNSDTNAYKKASKYFLKNVGLRWWIFPNPSIGINFEYASGSIPTVGTKGQALESSQTYLNPGLLYRSRLFFIPVVYSATYFINQFKTENTDDFLIGSTYSGVNLGITFYYPARFRIFKLGPVSFFFNNIEAGAGIAPSVQVSDKDFERGDKVSGRQFSFNAGAEFNLGIRGLRFTDDLFIVAEGGRQSYSLAFSGPTKGALPSGALIPEGNQNTETQTWFGVRIKYNMRDFVGELFESI